MLVTSSLCRGSFCGQSSGAVVSGFPWISAGPLSSDFELGKQTTNSPLFASDHLKDSGLFIIGESGFFLTMPITGFGLFIFSSKKEKKGYCVLTAKILPLTHGEEWWEERERYSLNSSFSGICDFHHTKLGIGLIGKAKGGMTCFLPPFSCAIPPSTPCAILLKNSLILGYVPDALPT